MSNDQLPRCPSCVMHPGWAHGNLAHRNEPEDVCRACLGSGVETQSVLATPQDDEHRDASEYCWGRVPDPVGAAFDGFCRRRPIGSYLYTNDDGNAVQGTLCSACVHDLAASTRLIAVELQ